MPATAKYMVAKKKAKKKVKVKKADAIERVGCLLPLLNKAYPKSKCELRYRSPLQLLVATILSSQCTDVRVNMVTRKLFEKYKKVDDFAKAVQAEFEEDIRATGFFRNKAKNIIEACNQIIENFDGKVPDTIDELTTLAGVGRKTANCIIMNAFGQPGISCDTHVIRLCRRLGLSANGDAVKLEFDLAEIVPRGKWTMFSHLLVFHGRNVCLARKPHCEKCVLNDVCPSAGKV